jgi:CubicO group peptidase (beta-lactamase class C family)
MTTIRMAQGGGRTLAPPVRGGSIVRQVLLACGILSSLLYVATDVLGGMRYPGYSFTSQAISELMAIGAPSEAFVDPLFITYGVLALAFGVGVFLEGAGRSRALRTAGALLSGYAVVGFAGPTVFEMHQRGAGGADGDAPHIVLTGALVLLTLLAMSFGAFALGKRFRIFSFATLLTLIVLGALTAPYGARLAAGQPTPGFGIVERILIYSSLLWVAVLAIALLRRPSHRGATAAPLTATTHVDGFVAPGFEEVRAEFERNFAERGEIGAAVAAYWRGEKVVDLWGGRRTPEGDAPWNEDTMVVVMSTTKGLAAMTLAVANARGWLDYDAPVARYWPEFAQNGKGAITVRQLLGHEAGLVLLDEELTIEKLRDLDYVARLLARQKPAWPPGTRHGYHAMTVGFYMQELIRRVDPAHRTLGRFFREEIAVPLGLEFYVGLPPEIPDSRLAKVKPLSAARAMLALTHSTPELLERVLWPWSLLRRSLAIPADVDFNDRRSLEVELPAGNGVGTARAIARAYSAIAEGGAEIGITPETFARVTAPPGVAHPHDAVLGVPTYFSLGFARPGPGLGFGSSPRAVGAPGAGGSFAFADPDARLGYAYVMNKLDFWLIDDPREKPLRDAAYRAIARLTDRPDGRDGGARSRQVATVSTASAPLEQRPDGAVPLRWLPHDLAIPEVAVRTMCIDQHALRGQPTQRHESRVE